MLNGGWLGTPSIAYGVQTSIEEVKFLENHISINAKNDGLRQNAMPPSQHAESHRNLVQLCIHS